MSETNVENLVQYNARLEACMEEAQHLVDDLVKQLVGVQEPFNSIVAQLWEQGDSAAPTLQQDLPVALNTIVARMAEVLDDHTTARATYEAACLHVREQEQRAAELKYASRIAALEADLRQLRGY